MEKAKKIYLDVCTLCRPFDEQNQTRIRMETDAYYLILESIPKNKYAMVISPVHILEINAIPNSYERIEIITLINRFGNDARYDKFTGRKRAEYLIDKGFGIADAAHISVAEQSANNYITCDDKLIRKCKRQGTHLRVMNPVEFCMEEDLK